MKHIIEKDMMDPNNWDESDFDGFGDDEKFDKIEDIEQEIDLKKIGIFEDGSVFKSTNYASSHILASTLISASDIILRSCMRPVTLGNLLRLLSSDEYLEQLIEFIPEEGLSAAEEELVMFRLMDWRAAFRQEFKNEILTIATCWLVSTFYEPRI